MNLSRISTHTERGRCIASVEIVDRDGGHVATVEMPATALSTVAKFRSALLSRAGVMFVTDWYDGRDGRDLWRFHVNAALNAGRRQEATP